MNVSKFGQNVEKSFWVFFTVLYDVKVLSKPTKKQAKKPCQKVQKMFASQSPSSRIRKPCSAAECVVQITTVQEYFRRFRFK